MRFTTKVQIIRPLASHINHAIPAIDYCSGKIYGREAVCTAIENGDHMTGSYHYKGLAIDLRSWYWLSDAKPRAFASLLRIVLGPTYQVVVERTHVHVEYDPEGAGYFPYTGYEEVKSNG